MISALRYGFASVAVVSGRRLPHWPGYVGTRLAGLQGKVNEPGDGVAHPRFPAARQASSTGPGASRCARLSPQALRTSRLAAFPGVDWTELLRSSSVVLLFGPLTCYFYGGGYARGTVW